MCTHSKQLTDAYSVVHGRKSLIPRCARICPVTGSNEDRRCGKGKPPREEKEPPQIVGSAGGSSFCQMLSWPQEESEKDPEADAKPVMERGVPSKCLQSFNQNPAAENLVGD